MALTEDIATNFNKAFAAMTRIEPRCRANDFSKSLEMRTADPLWMLGRQWQFGELTGEDAGSPINISVCYKNQLMDTVTLGATGDPICLRPEEGSADCQGAMSRPPLEMLVERIPLRMDWRTRIQIGQQFEKILLAEVLIAEQAQSLICFFHQECPVEVPDPDTMRQIDYATQRFIRLMAGRAIEGEALLPILESNTLPAMTLTYVEEEFELARVKLLDWFGKLYNQPGATDGNAWVNGKLHHEFGLSSTDADDNITRIKAPDYRNGELDWHSFSYDSAESSAWDPPADCEGAWISRDFTPTRVAFGGMPHPRLFAFEDGNTDFGDLDVVTTDLSKLMMMEFALVHGDDFYMLPLPLPVGSLTWIKKITVTDVFGITKDIEICAGYTYSATNPLAVWDMFKITEGRHLIDDFAASFLFLPPTVHHRQESEPIEEILFMRDEGANLVFAVEHIVQNKFGKPIDGFDAQLEKKQRLRDETGGATATPGSATGGDDTGLPQYRLASTVPDNWIPFLPQIIALGSAEIVLRRGTMLRNEDDHEATEIDAMTRMFDVADPGALTWLREESVPRAGVKVQLTWQRARWIDGETYVWLGRKVKTGRGEGSSGLLFDWLKE